MVQSSPEMPPKENALPCPNRRGPPKNVTGPFKPHFKNNHSVKPKDI